MKIAAIILAAGEGRRFYSPIPKQYLMLHHKKIYRYPLDTISSSNLFDQTLLVIGKGHDRYLDKDPPAKIIIGGTTRQESVFIALHSLTKIDYVMIFDAARPFLTRELIDQHRKMLQQGFVAVNTCTPCTDTINITTEGMISSIPKREQFLKGQTPQSFALSPLLSAHQKTGKTYTDDCAILLDAGFKVGYVDGFEHNIKITTPFDLQVATLLAQ